MSVRDYQQRRMADICDKPKPQIVDDPCVVCEATGTRHDPVVVRPEDRHRIPAHYRCHEKLDAIVDNVVAQLEGGAA